MQVPIPRSSDKPPRSRLYGEFLPQVAALPGVQSVAGIDNLPMEGGSEQPIAVEGRPAEVFALQRNVSVRQMTPEYFRTMGIPIVAGRDLQATDTSGMENNVVISKAMARLFWPGENAIGKRFRISFTPDTVRTVVGVAGDIKARGLDVLEPVTMLYLPYRQDDMGNMMLVVRGAGSSPVASLAPAITRVLGELDPTLPVRNVRTMNEVIATTLSQHQFSMWLFAALAGLAFLLATVGIYSVLAYSVRSRIHEIGVRIALGAGPADVIRLVVAEGMRPALIGVVVGAAGAYALGGVLSKLVYGVSPADPLTFITVAVLLSVVAAAACAIPAYRATRVIHWWPCAMSKELRRKCFVLPAPSWSPTIVRSRTAAPDPNICYCRRTILRSPRRNRPSTPGSAAKRPSRAASKSSETPLKAPGHPGFGVAQSLQRKHRGRDILIARG